MIPANKECTADEFDCGGGKQCILRGFVCDNVKDCENNRDEENCGKCNRYATSA